MLTATYRQVRKAVGEWRRRARTRRELALLCPAERHELAFRYDINTELGKWFWQA
jgi:uncharacterized protein YjiS (DUF1127 family)